MRTKSAEAIKRQPSIAAPSRGARLRQKQQPSGSPTAFLTRSATSPRSRSGWLDVAPLFRCLRGTSSAGPSSNPMRE
jgi:hypothetical protein